MLAVVGAVGFVLSNALLEAAVVLSGVVSLVATALVAVILRRALIAQVIAPYHSPSVLA